MERGSSLGTEGKLSKELHFFFKTLLTKEDLHVSAKVSFSSEDLVIASVHS